MAGQEVKEFIMKLRADTGELQRGLQQANEKLANLEKAAQGAKTGFTELNQGAEIGKKAAELVGDAYRTLIGLIDRGQAVTELTNAFHSLGGTSASLETLRGSTQGLVSDIDIMRASNQAMLADLSPEQFLDVAKAADTLGDAVGVDTKQAMDQLVTAVATGNERLLKQYGILIDNKKAEADFAHSIGTTADKLSESGKREAARIAILEKMREQTEKLGTANDTAGDALQHLRVDFENAIDKAAKWVNENEIVIDVLQRIRKFAGEAGEGLRKMFADDLDSQITRLRSNIATLDDELSGTVSSFFANTLGGQDENVLAGMREELSQLEKLKGFVDTNEQVAKTFVELNDAAGKFILTVGEGKPLDSYISKAKEAKKEIKELKDSLPEFLNLNQQFQGGPFDWIDTAFGDGLGSKISDLMSDMEKEAKDAFRNSVNFFEDILTTTITGSSQSLEQILMDALKRVAIGFGGQLLGEIAKVFGGSSILGQIGSATGLGESIASGFGSAIKDFFGSSGIWGSAATSGIGPLASGDAYAGALGKSSTALAGSATSLTSIAAAMLPIVAGAGGILAMYQGIVTGNKPLANGAGALTFGLVTGGASAFLPGVASDFFGGNSHLAQEREAREEFLNSILNGGSATFQGVNGPHTLSAGEFNIDTSKPGNDTAVGLGNPIAHVLTGGDDKLGSDAAAMFANAISEAENFNEQLVNTQALMDKFGLSATEVKDELLQLFLDGKISAEEFTTDLHNVNLAAQDDLVGPDSVSDAIKIFAKNIDTNPRVALKGLGLAFKEMKDLGIDTTQEIHDFIAQKYPELLPVFDGLAAAGIDTFEEIKNASADQVAQIFGIVKPLQGVFEESFGGAAESAGDVGDEADHSAGRVEQSADRMVRAWEKVERAANGASEATRQIGA